MSTEFFEVHLSTLYSTGYQNITSFHLQICFGSLLYPKCTFWKPVVVVIKHWISAGVTYSFNFIPFMYCHAGQLTFHTFRVLYQDVWISSYHYAKKLSTGIFSAFVWLTHKNYFWLMPHQQKVKVCFGNYFTCVVGLSRSFHSIPIWLITWDWNTCILCSQLYHTLLLFYTNAGLHPGYEDRGLHY